MEAEHSERKRKPKFTEKEVDVMVRKIQENSVTLFSRFSDSITLKKKNIAWNDVHRTVNATSMVSRSVEEIEKKWDDLKRIIKKRAIDVKKDLNKTGGGERLVEPLTETEEMVVSLIGEEKIFGITTGIDTFQAQPEVCYKRLAI